MRRTTILLGLLVSFGLVACDSATSPAASSEGTAATSGVTTVDAALAANHALGVERAELGEGFCFFVIFDPAFGGYSGSSKAVTTPSGNTNYHCTADRLFGDPVDRAHRIRDVAFNGEFFAVPPGTLLSSDIQIAAGPNGQATVSCHEKD